MYAIFPAAKSVSTLTFYLSLSDVTNAPTIGAANKSALVIAVTVHPYVTAEGCFPKLLADGISVCTPIEAAVDHGVTLFVVPSTDLAFVNVLVASALLNVFASY